MLEQSDFRVYSAGALPAETNVSDLGKEPLDTRATKCGGSMVSLPSVKSTPHFVQRLEVLNREMQLMFATVDSGANLDRMDSNDRLWLCENLGLLHSTLASLVEAQVALTRTPHVRCSGQVAPRVLVVAEDLLTSIDYAFSDSGFSAYLQAMQRTVVLRLDELRALVPALQCVLLERIATLANLALARKAVSLRFDSSTRLNTIGTCIRSLHEIDQAPWQELMEPLIVFDEVLRRDPAGAYAHMDPESREMYRNAVVKLAKHSGSSELGIAELALSLARDSQRVPEDDPVLAHRRAHVGYYLIAEGRDLLRKRANGWSPLRERWQSFLRRYPDEIYLGGIEALTLGMILAVLRWGDVYSVSAPIFATLLLLLPCSESAGQIVNYLTSSFLQPQVLPKLDFRNGIPCDCTTMVVVPTLLLSEKQVRKLVSDLEVRYLANQSAHLHFALLTDLPDSEKQPSEDDPLVGLCGQLIRDLNEKYDRSGAGKFAMFHRHRVYSPHEGVWMGWERKRGKLLDFNRLILGQFDSFPYKVGDLSVLPRVRYVLTVDADTELPRGSAQRLIGTLAHPLCRAVIDSRNVVTKGFGILQPRVAVSVESAAQSRLASIHSGAAGFDIYTRATSDVYQDLYGEGTFVGKGLYDLRAVHRVLDGRFPRNTILSHDLIEGAYARAGLVSDVDVVDSYPSQYSTYTRRKHRWVRGDWQIVEWLFSRVPDEEGGRVANPISLISRWKILDNLRRSMVGPATLLLFILGWTVLPGRPLYWTVVSLAILFVPPWFQFAVAVGRALVARSFAQVRDASASLRTASTSVLLFLTFLIHDALISLDAMVRSSYRRAVSRERLLEWETMAEAELGVSKSSSLDLYMAWTPVIAALIGVMLLLARPRALLVAAPILGLWACCRVISAWIDRPPSRERDTVAPAERKFLRLAALRTWRYFEEYSSAQHHWLIPDSVQEEPPNIAARVSPTNLGFLLNARQIACELGYLTVPEFVEQTRRTLETTSHLRRYRGHFLNWYETRMLAPEPPHFISSVDNGNLAASLIALKVGCTALLNKPLLSPALVEGYEDHLRLATTKSLPGRELDLNTVEQDDQPWLERLLDVVTKPVAYVGAEIALSGASWFATQLHLRREQAQKLFTNYMPWLLPEFGHLLRGLGPDTENIPPLEGLPGFIQQLQTKLLYEMSSHSDTASDEASKKAEGERLLTLLPGALKRASSLAHDLRLISATAERLVAEMDFSFLLERRRKLLSIGYHVDTGTLDPACYDLLASEARTAAFIAIAKGDVPQETWFRLGRSHVPVKDGAPTLISWAGSMFEYLMPAIWMRSQRNTLLRRSMEGAVRAQEAYASAKQIPWGISEASYCEINDGGMYCYTAMGVPELSLRESVPERLVVAPYASAMALAVDAVDALNNMHRMAELGWVGEYGFYEAADFGPAKSPRAHAPCLVRGWMAHHQGMILLSIGNLLCGNIVQQWFHGDAQMRATELLLDERPIVQHVRPSRHVRSDARPPVRFAKNGGPKGDDHLAIAS